jgi:hypothetical protein
MAEIEGSRAFELAIAEVDRQIDALQRAREHLVRLMGRPVGDTPSFTSSSAVIEDSVAAVREQEFSGLSAAKAARAFLQKIGRHERTPVIITALKKGGVEIRGKNPVSTLYTTLSRRPAFVSLGKNYWDLAERRPDLVQDQKSRAAASPKRRKKRGPGRPKKAVRNTPELAATA